MKRIIICCLIAICIYVLSGCSGSKKYSDVIAQTDVAESTRFSKLAEWEEYDPYRYYIITWDKAEDVVYLHNNTNYKGGITVMFDRDGKPMTREGWYRSIRSNQSDTDTIKSGNNDIIINNTINNEN